MYFVSDLHIWAYVQLAGHKWSVSPHISYQPGPSNAAQTSSSSLSLVAFSPFLQVCLRPLPQFNQNSSELCQHVQSCDKIRVFLMWWDLPFQSFKPHKKTTTKIENCKKYEIYKIYEMYKMYEIYDSKKYIFTKLKMELHYGKILKKSLAQPPIVLCHHCGLL